VQASEAVPLVTGSVGPLGIAVTEPPKFRESAAVVLLRGSGQGLEVFWVRRSDGVAFMPGFHAFVGGSLSPEDAELPIEGTADVTDRVLRACAIRETFEETGVLLGLTTAVHSGELTEARRRFLAGEIDFTRLAREQGWSFRATDLTYAGRWTTPPFAAIRFTTSYFVARLPAAQEPSVRVGELAAGEWITPVEALGRWKSGEVTFAAPILSTLKELARGEEGLIERMTLAPERMGQPVRRIELKWGIVLHPMKTRPLPPATHTNAYLVGEQDMALIDPGSDDADELEALFRLVDSLALDGRRLTLVLLTHHHADHVAGVQAVRARYGVPVAAHRDTAHHVRADRTLEDGEVISLARGVRDWDLTCLHTPGHTRGHLCFLHRRTRSLFCGDHIPGGAGTVIIDPPEGDMAAYLGSLERLQGESVETLFPAHGSPQGAAPGRVQSMIYHRRERERKVLEALGRAPRSLGTLVERAYGDTPRELWCYAERSLLAHLVKLEAERRAERVGDQWRAAPSRH
jgi:ribonuclease/clavin/mitogillin